MKLKVISPRGVILNREVSQATFPGVAGEFMVLPHHAPIVAELAAGQISYAGEGGGDPVDIAGGYVEVSDGAVEAYVEE